MKYKYKILFNNGHIAEGDIVAEDLDQVHDILMTNKFQQIDNLKKGVYFNIKEITAVDVVLVEEGD